MDYKQRKDIESKNKDRLINAFGYIPDVSGIYVLTREENGFKYAYIGQAKHILTRLAEHLSGWQHIDNSIKNHGLYSQENTVGWKATFYLYGEAYLDTQEQYFIKKYANEGYQLRNKTAGGQGQGKFEIAETKGKNGYRDGLNQGYKNAQKEIKKLFENNLTFSINGKENKLKQRSFEKFKRFLDKT